MVLEVKPIIENIFKTSREVNEGYGFNENKEFGIRANAQKEISGPAVITTTLNTISEINDVEVEEGNKVLLSATMMLNCEAANNATTFSFYRDETLVYNLRSIRSADGNNDNLAVSLHYLDEPAAGTYKYSLRAQAASLNDSVFDLVFIEVTFK